MEEGSLDRDPKFTRSHEDGEGISPHKKEKKGRVKSS